jgi:hypothetical protein
MDDRDVGMVQRRKDLCFSPEPGEALGISRERVGDHFQASSSLSAVWCARQAHPRPPLRRGRSPHKDRHECDARCGILEAILLDCSLLNAVNTTRKKPFVPKTSDYEARGRGSVVGRNCPKSRRLELAEVVVNNTVDEFELTAGRKGRD